MEHSHTGIVEKSENGVVTVKITVVSGCSSCEAKSSCSIIESSKRNIEIATRSWRNYNIGDNVVVGTESQNGLRAIWLAYLLPAILTIAVFCLLYNVVGEVATALLTLLCVGLYWIALWLMKKKTEKKFSFKIRHCEEKHEQ